MVCGVWCVLCGVVCGVWCVVCGVHYAPHTTNHRTHTTHHTPHTTHTTRHHTLHHTPDTTHTPHHTPHHTAHTTISLRFFLCFFGWFLPPFLDVVAFRFYTPSSKHSGQVDDYNKHFFRKPLILLEMAKTFERFCSKHAIVVTNVAQLQLTLCGRANEK